MKNVLLVLSIVLAAASNVLAQTASDYYTPLSIGSHTTLHTTSVGTSSGWAYRITSYTFEGADFISGRQYFREKARDIMDESGDTDVFRIIWLRKDSVGNVALGAINTSNESSNIDSAMIVDAGNWFPNEFLTKGYSRTYPYGNLSYQDSVLSVTETINVLAGTFNNCLEIRVTHFDSTGAAVFREYQYYASGVGMVKNVRTLPDNQANTSELVGYGATGVRNNAISRTPREFMLAQNYPNPFNPSTMIAYRVPSNNHVSLKVFNVLGCEVATLVNEVQSAGSYHVTFHAANLPSGIYFYRLHSGSLTETKRLVLLK